MKKIYQIVTVLIAISFNAIAQDAHTLTAEDVTIADNTITAYNASFTDIVIPGSIGKTAIKTIGESAFENKGLTSVVFEDGVETIGARAFRLNIELLKVTLPSTLKTLEGNQNFRSTAIREITIPEGVKDLPFYCFYKCSNLVSASLPTSLVIIDRAFSDCNVQIAIELPSQTPEGFKLKEGWTGYDKRRGNQLSTDIVENITSANSQLAFIRWVRKK